MVVQNVVRDVINIVLKVIVYHIQKDCSITNIPQTSTLNIVNFQKMLYFAIAQKMFLKFFLSQLLIMMIVWNSEMRGKKIKERNSHRRTAVATCDICDVGC